MLLGLGCFLRRNPPERSCLDLLKSFDRHCGPLSRNLLVTRHIRVVPFGVEERAPRHRTTIGLSAEAPKNKP